MNSRYYDPEVGRFINADDPTMLFETAGVAGGANLYAYCLNNPVMYTDSTGESIFGDIWKWVKKNATQIGLTVASAAMIIGGTVMVATGFGAPIGAMLIGAGVGSLIGGYTSGNFAQGWLAGGVAGCIATIPGGGYLGAALWGGVGMVAGGMINGNITNLVSWETAIYFGLGAVANVGAKFISGKVGSLLASRANKQLGSYLASQLSLGDFAGHAMRTGAMRGVMNSMQKAIMLSSGNYSRSLVYAFTNAGVSNGIALLY